MKRTLALLTLAFLVVTAGCPNPGPGPLVGNAVIDCTQANQGEVLALLLELTPLVTPAATDWSVVYQRAKHAGSTIGGCVLAQLVQGYLGNRSAPPATPADGWSAHDALERFRAAEAGGATFHVQLPDGSTANL